MAKVNAQQWLQKWDQRLTASTQYITAGVNAVTTAPGQLAAAAQDRMLTNLQAAVNSGLWANRVSSVSLADWKSAMINKGIPRISLGAQTAEKTKVQVITNLLAAVDTAAQSAKALPKGGIQQSIARAAAFMTAMNQAKGQIRG